MGSEVGSVKRKRDQVGVFRSNVTIYVSTKGSDSNSGLSESTPFRTIQKAFNFLKNYTILEEARVTIRLASGVYTISSTLIMDHPQGDRITIQGDSGIVSPIDDITEYTDTTSYTGRVGSRSYKRIRRALNENGFYSSGQRYDMMIQHKSSNTFPRNSLATGKYAVVSPIDSNFEIQAQYNSAGTGLGSLSSNTDIKRFDEEQTTMRRFFGFGAHKITLNTNDLAERSTLLENRIRNNNPWPTTTGAVTSRDQSLADPSQANPHIGGNTKVDVRYIGTIINVSGNGNGIKIDNSALTIKDLVFQARDPATSSAGAVTSSGIYVTNGSVCTLDQGVVVANFDIGIEVDNKSLLTQSSTSMNPFQSITNCNTGILIVDGSSCVLNGMFITGCWNDGVVVNGNSSADLSSCAVIGCGKDGFISSRNSDITANRCFSVYNTQNSAVGFSVNTESGIGFGSRLNSNIECVGCYSFRNGFGYFADKNGSLLVSSSDSRDNLDYGLCSSEGANAIVGPFFHSEADAAGVLATDSSSCKIVFSKFNNTGFDTATGVKGSCFTTTAMSNLSLYDVDTENFAKNAIETMYNGVVIGDGINIKENANTEGDSINSTYNSMVRLAGACAGSKPKNRFSLQNGYIEINGVEVDE